MEQNGIAALMEASVGGVDYESPRVTLDDLLAEDACLKKPGWPYSIAELIAHAHYWQSLWLRRIAGEEVVSPFDHPDWPPVSVAEWSKVREEFLDDVESSIDLAGRSSEVLGSGHRVSDYLISCALHNAYHLGQVCTLRRELGLWPPAGSSDYSVPS